MIVSGRKNIKIPFICSTGHKKIEGFQCLFLSLLFPYGKSLRILAGMIWFRPALAAVCIAITVMALPVFAQEVAAKSAEIAKPVAVPAEKGLVFVELFSAERCPFCPQAERNMNDILTDPQVLGFTCMVDYFDAGLKGPLSRPFCTTQQDLYIRMLKSGSRYTPQMVINGRVQLPGYNFQKTAEAIRAQRAGAIPVMPLLIQAGDKEGVYDIVLPQLAAPGDEQKDSFVLRLIVTQKESPAQTGEHRQAREKMPSNIAVAILDAGLWDGKRTVWSVTPPQDIGGDSFILVAQDRRSGAILAAGNAALLALAGHHTD